MKKRQAYFDNASTTPLDGRVLKAMMPYLTDDYGNPSNLYETGRCAKKAISQASLQVAEVLNCKAEEVIFTGSATEADNLAIAGAARAHKEHGNRIIISSLEHKGIMAVCTALEKEGFEIIKLPVGKDGMVNPEEVRKNINDKTIIVSVTMADSETGTLQPIKEIAKVIEDVKLKTQSSRLKIEGQRLKVENINDALAHNASSAATQDERKLFRHERSDMRKSVPVVVGGAVKHGGVTFPIFHTDASQAAAYAEINVEKLGVDLLTLSAHKLRGPKGIGALYVRRGVKLSPIIYGGGQQGSLRSGTENVPAIVGFGEAIELNEIYKKKGSVHVKKLRDALQKGIFTSIKKVVLNGHPTKRLPNFLNISILDIEGESLLLELDEHGIMINTGSACNSESLEPSYVLTALGNPYEFVHGSIRFSLGKDTTMSDVNYVLKYLPKIVERLRKISPLDLSKDERKVMSDPRAFIGNQTPHFLRKKK
jgi:cysteine desulfurase